MIPIKRLKKDAILPAYAHEDDAGMDLFAQETVILKPGQRTSVSTGIAMAIPQGYVGLIWDKSGIAANAGLKTMAGVIDASYRGEIKILLHNLSTESYTIEKGKKIAQMLIQPVAQKKIVEVHDLDETTRGKGGFGSTGLKPRD